jgi:sugar transferase (PEP-CTERM/EpsH1 system associated)
MNILFVAPRLPCPPFKGDQLRVYQQMQMLCRKHNIVLLAFYEKKSDLNFVSSLEKYCKIIYYLKLSRIRSILNITVNIFLSSLPFQILYYRSNKFDKMLKNILVENKIDVVYAFLLRMAEHVKNIPVLTVLDCIDSMTLNLTGRLKHDSGINFFLINEELKRIKRYEQELGNSFSRLVVCSDIDKTYLNAENINVIPNPVAFTEFFPDNSCEKRQKQIVFSGMMDYFPNIQAVTWFVKECFPFILKKFPEAVFVIAGNNPAWRVKKLATPNKIIVTGFVPVMREYLNKSVIAIAPMQSGSGVQNKILEAMACGLPVITTGIGAGGIKAIHGREIFIADNAEQFISCVCEFLDDENLAKEIGMNAYNFVKTEHSFERVAYLLENVFNCLC